MGGFRGLTPESDMPQGVPTSTPIEQSFSNASTIDRILSTIEKPISDSTIRAANMPIPGGHAGTVPSSIATPIAPYQERSLDQRRVTGRNAARRQGIANTFTAAGNALGAIVTKEAQIKQNHIKDAATKVLTAQQAIDEAKIMHDQAIASGDAAAASKYQEMIQQNQQTRDTVFADPKMRKALQKGFDISYTDPQSNKTEEHAAVQAALKDAKTAQEKRQAMQQFQQQRQQQAGAAMGQAFEKSLPQDMTANTLAQAQLANVQQSRKESVELYKSMLPAIIRGDASVKVENIRALTELQKAHDAFQQQNFAREMQFQNALKLIDARKRADISKFWAEIPAAVEKEKRLLDARSTNPATIQKNAEDSMRGWGSQVDSWTGRLASAKQNLQLLQQAGSGATQEQIGSAKSEVDAATQGLDKVQKEAAYYNGLHKTLLSAVGLPEMNDLPDQASGGAANADTSTDESDSSIDVNNFTAWYTLP